MLIMLPFNKCLLLTLIRRVWIIDFPLMGSNGAESLGTEAIIIIVTNISLPTQNILCENLM